MSSLLSALLIEVLIIVELFAHLTLQWKSKHEELVCESLRVTNSHTGLNIFHFRLNFTRPLHTACLALLASSHCLHLGKLSCSSPLPFSPPFSPSSPYSDRLSLAAAAAVACTTELSCQMPLPVSQLLSTFPLEFMHQLLHFLEWRTIDLQSVEPRTTKSAIQQ